MAFSERKIPTSSARSSRVNRSFVDHKLLEDEADALSALHMVGTGGGGGGGDDTSNDPAAATTMTGTVEGGSTTASSGGGGTPTSPAVGESKETAPAGPTPTSSVSLYSQQNRTLRLSRPHEERLRSSALTASTTRFASTAVVSRQSGAVLSGSSPIEQTAVSSSSSSSRRSSHLSNNNNNMGKDGIDPLSNSFGKDDEEPTPVPPSSNPSHQQQQQQPLSRSTTSSSSQRPSPPNQHSTTLPPTTTPPPTPLTISEVAVTVLVSFAKQLWLILHGILRGMLDSLHMIRFLRYASRSAEIRRMLRDCAVINGVLLFGLFALSTFVRLTPIGDQGMVAQAWRSVFGVAWVMPMYAATQLLGLRWYEELYRLTSEEKQRTQRAAIAALKGHSPEEDEVRTTTGVPPPPPPPGPSFYQASEAALKFIVTLLYTIVIALVGLVPGVGSLIGFAMASWLHAFYCFDYRFLSQYQYDRKRGVHAPLPLTTILAIFESFWPYYLGYGMTHLGMRAVLERYFLLDVVSTLAVCSAVFAVNVVTTVDADPLLVAAPALQLPVLSPLFAWVIQWKLAFGRWILDQARARSASRTSSSVVEPRQAGEQPSPRTEPPVKEHGE